MSLNPSDLGELLRRAQLAKQLQGQSQPDDPGAPGAVVPIPSSQPVQSPVTSPDMAPVQQTMGAYRQQLEQGGPNIADYHPSLGRLITAVALGAIGGMHDPKTGFQVGHDIAYGPYDKQLTGYQQRLAEKKAAYEAEEKGAEGQAKIGELLATKEAEAAKKGEAESHRKVLDFEGSPEGREYKKDLARIEHPGATGREYKQDGPYEATLANGEVLHNLWANPYHPGQWLDADTNTPIESTAFTKQPIKKEPGSSTAQPNEYKDFREEYLAKHGTLDGVAAAYTKSKATPEKPPQAIMIDPASGVAQLVRPGMKVAPGSVTPSGLSSENVPTAPTRQMAETAPKVLDLTKRVRELVDQQEKTLGPASGRWAEFMTGKVGAPNPEFAKLRTNVLLLQTLLLRMHIGARGGQQMMEHFRSLINAGGQSPENLRAVLDEIDAYAKDVAGEAGKGGPSGSQVTPSGGGTVTNPKDPLGILKK